MVPIHNTSRMPNAISTWFSHIKAEKQEVTTFIPRHKACRQRASTKTSSILQSRGITGRKLCQHGKLCKLKDMYERGHSVWFLLSHSVGGEGRDTSKAFLRETLHLRVASLSGKTVGSSPEKTLDRSWCESEEPYSLFLDPEKSHYCFHYCKLIRGIISRVQCERLEKAAPVVTPSGSYDFLRGFQVCAAHNHSLSLSHF